MNDNAGGQSRSDKAQEKPQTDNTPLILEAIKGEVARITSTIEAQRDEAESKRKEDREIRDLDAQEMMAVWTKRAVWAAGVGIIVTIFGVFLIWRTLVATKEAASYAKLAADAAKATVELSRTMVGEGEKATAAALAAAKQAGRQADLFEQSVVRLERPYLYVFGVHQIELNDGHNVRYSVANFGRTPAEITILAVGMSTHSHVPIDPLIVDYRDNPEHDLLVRPILPPNDIRKDLLITAPGGIKFKPPKRYEGAFQVSFGNIIPDIPEDEHFFVWIRINYRGPMGGHMTNACWRYDKLTNRLVRWGEKEQYNSML